MERGKRRAVLSEVRRHRGMYRAAGDYEGNQIKEGWTLRLRKELQNLHFRMVGGNQEELKLFQVWTYYNKRSSIFLSSFVIVINFIR